MRYTSPVMPIIKSAIKRVRQAKKRRSHNLQVLRAVQADTKAVITAATSGDKKKAQELLNDAYSEIDRAVKKGTLHKNTAARRKSQLAKIAGGNAKAAAKTADKPKAAAKKPAAKKTPAKTPAKK